MGEVKSVKVDNWGVFFLQKLQNFFNKTDYCDLVLQFNDNSQLKVHRLVLSACTDYFNVLVNTCETMGDILVMPHELQADVIVPIVNFMYTGTLEFEINMYSRLLTTAQLMNMTVLLKLLEAHKKTVESPRQMGSIQGQLAKAPTKRITQTVATNKRNMQNIGRIQQTKMPANIIKKSPQMQRYKSNEPNSKKSQPAKVYQQKVTFVKGPSRYDGSDDTSIPPESFEPSFVNISYESKPLITANQIIKEEYEMSDYENSLVDTKINKISAFEQLKKSYNSGSNKRPASSSSSYDSPPEKKPNIEDVKEFAEQQRVRKQIAAEFDDDHEYDDVLDEDFQNDDDDEDYVPPKSVSKIVKNDNEGFKPLVIRQEKNQNPKIVVKETAGSNVDHSKLISEVLKKYPNLVKNNKNIKLKIMPKSGTSVGTKIIIKQESTALPQKPITESINEPMQKNQNPIIKKTNIVNKVKQVPSQQKKPVNESSVNSPPNNAQPRRIDSKTMYALIAKGAENTTGPWLCLKCGIDGRPISFPSYRGFRRHLVNIHKEQIDRKLCEQCGWRSSDMKQLQFHLLDKHSIKLTNGVEFPKCEICEKICINNEILKQHIQETHKDSEECNYCTKIFSDAFELYQHLRHKHKDQARQDGIGGFSDEEFFDSENEYSQIEEELVTESNNEKIKILSDISLPKNTLLPGRDISTKYKNITIKPVTKNKTSTERKADIIDITKNAQSKPKELTTKITAEDINNSETKFLGPDGNVMELSLEQKQEIISQLEEQHGGVVMFLNQDSFNCNNEIDESNIVTIPSTNNTNNDVTNVNDMLIVLDPQAKNETESTIEMEDQLETIKEETLKTKIIIEEETKTEIVDSNEKDIEKYELEDTNDNTDKDLDKNENETSNVKDTSDKNIKLDLLTSDWSEDEEDYEKKFNENSKSKNENSKNSEEKKSSPEPSSKIDEVYLDLVVPSKDTEQLEENSNSKVVKSESNEEFTSDIDINNVENTKNNEVSEISEKNKSIKNEKTEKQEIVEEYKSEIEDDNCNDEQKSKETECSIIPKIEIKNLISDWGDDDDDEA